jgi:hypothetical protein
MRCFDREQAKDFCRTKAIKTLRARSACRLANCIFPDQGQISRQKRARVGLLIGERTVVLNKLCDSQATFPPNF